MRSENRPQTGPDHFFYSIQRHKIEKANRATAGRKVKLAPWTLQKGRPKKINPIKPTEDELLDTFKGLKLQERKRIAKVGKLSRNGRRIIS